MIDITGEVFGEWTVLRHIAASTWLCRCSCGVEKPVGIGALRRGDSTKCRSCGTSRHGAASRFGVRSREYQSWLAMNARCNTPSHEAYARYGGRGITVCERWKSFENFLADMGPRPAKKSLDRYPNKDGNYEPGNCRWATAKEQGRNKSNSTAYTHNGKTATIAEWAEIKGMPRARLRERLLKMTIEQALAMPYKPRNSFLTHEDNPL